MHHLYLKKFSYILVLFCIFSIGLFSEETGLNSYTYCTKCFEKEINQFAALEPNFQDKLVFVRNMHDILIDFVYTADESTFYQQMQLIQPFIEVMLRVNDTIFFDFFQGKYSDRRPVDLKGGKTYIYYNTYAQNRELTEQERKQFYEKDISSHKTVQQERRKQLDKHCLRDLEPGQTYNFIITPQNITYISYDQRYKLRDLEQKKALMCPDHTILAGNHPVLCAGVINMYEIGSKKLFVISSSSGHFRPFPDSLIHLKNCLIKLGVPEESIICFSVPYEKINRHIEVIK